jgi:predicted glycoside hydrolase/deacetylase ChbG (UPF0249 family)
MIQRMLESVATQKLSKYTISALEKKIHDAVYNSLGSLIDSHNFNKYYVLEKIRLQNDANFNIMTFSGYIDNTVMKLPIYFNSHMRIVEQSLNIIHWIIHVFIQDHGACKI